MLRREEASAILTKRFLFLVEEGEGSLVRSRPVEAAQILAKQSGSPMIIIGGAEDKENEKSILATFHQLAGGTQARILILPTASSMPEILGEVYRQLFVKMGVAKADVLRVASRYEAELSETAELVKTYTGLFMTGGDQLRLCQVIAGTLMADAMQASSQAGELVIAGTSAGASAMGDCMIARGYSGESPRRSIVDLTVGLGILQNVIIDQHFHNRNRLARLMTAVSLRPDCLGVGIDENTAVILQQDSSLEVMGEGSVAIVDGSELVYNTIKETESSQPFSVGSFRIHIMAKGQRFSLRDRKIL
jgi:cyanophycinase